MEGTIKTEREAEDVANQCQKESEDCDSSPQVQHPLRTEEEWEEEDSTRRKPKKKPKIKYRDAASPVRKSKLRTSKDIYDRLKWGCESITINSKAVDISSIHIGYKDRFLGMCEILFSSFVPFGATSKNEGETQDEEDESEDEEEECKEGEIPFHRVYYFRAGGPPQNPFIGRNGEIKVREDNWPEGSMLIWDRETRTDLIFQSGNTSSSPILF